MVLTLLCRLHIVWTLTEALDVLGETDAGAEFGGEDVALVQKQYKVDTREQLVAAYAFPEEYAVLLCHTKQQSVRPGITVKSSLDSPVD